MVTQWEVIVDPWQRPLVEVLIDGTWYRGEVRARRKNGKTWEASITYSKGVAQTYSGTFDMAGLRPDEAP